MRYWFVAIYAVTLGILFDLMFTIPAYAYIDPNAGGFFFQTVAPFIYGILAVITVFWRRITGFVKGILKRLRKQD